MAGIQRAGRDDDEQCADEYAGCASGGTSSGTTSRATGVPVRVCRVAVAPEGHLFSDQYGKCPFALDRYARIPEVYAGAESYPSLLSDVHPPAVGVELAPVPEAADGVEVLGFQSPG